MRAFVAVFPPSEVQEALAGAARGLPITGKVRFTPAANVHLTLKFLGAVPEDDLLGQVAEALEPLCERHEPFEAGVSGFGAFPSPRKARVLWAGVGEGSDGLRTIAEDVEECMEPLCFERENRPYVPHLTLGRARGRPVALETAEDPSPIPTFMVRRLDLVQSVPGAGYLSLAAYPLRTP